MYMLKEAREYNNSTCTKFDRNTYNFNFYLLNLEAENDGPYETEDKTRVPVHDVLCSNVLKVYLKMHQQ